MTDLKARVDCLLKDNSKLKGQVVAKEVQLKDIEALTSKVTTVEAKLVAAQKEQDEATAIFQIF